MPGIHDVSIIRKLLMQDPAWSVYALGDLAPGFTKHCQWWVSDLYPSALVLIYSGFQPPIFFSIGPAASAELMLAEIGQFECLYLQVKTRVFRILRPHFRSCTEKPTWRMAVTPDSFHACGRGNACRLAFHDLEALKRLYADGQYTAETPEFFNPDMLRHGIYYGIFQDGDLVAAAGTHLVTPAQGVAAIGNVYTRQDFRGHGLALTVTSAVAAELLTTVPLVALNVSQGNKSGIRVYEKLGFVRHCIYREGVAQLHKTDGRDPHIAD